MSPWIILQYCNTAILQYCNIAILQYCNTAILQYCNTAIMFCSSGEKIFFFDEKNVHSKLFSDDNNYKISNCLKHFYCELMKDKKILCNIFAWNAISYPNKKALTIFHDFVFIYKYIQAFFILIELFRKHFS